MCKVYKTNWLQYIVRKNKKILWGLNFHENKLQKNKRTTRNHQKTNT